jgi:segregation and condensation protein B
VSQYRERGGGFRLENLRKHGYQFRTVQAASPLMARMFASRPRPLSRAALETLAIIAYRQPVTRADVEFIRGVDSGSIIKNLLDRELVACVGRREDAGRPMLFGTSAEFLKVFNLQSLDELPPLSSFQPAQDVIREAKSRLNHGFDDVESDVTQLIEGSHPGQQIFEAVHEEEDFDNDSGRQASCVLEGALVAGFEADDDDIAAWDSDSKDFDPSSDRNKISEAVPKDEAKSELDEN